MQYDRIIMKENIVQAENVNHVECDVLHNYDRDFTSILHKFHQCLTINRTLKNRNIRQT
jgi:hypothetical protein